MDDFEVLDFNCYDDDAIEKYFDMGRTCPFYTIEKYPYRFNIDVFYEEIERGLLNFVKDFKSKKEINYHWAEDWMVLFQDWMGMYK